MVSTPICEHALSVLAAVPPDVRQVSDLPGHAVVLIGLRPSSRAKPAKKVGAWFLERHSLSTHPAAEPRRRQHTYPNTLNGRAAKTPNTSTIRFHTNPRSGCQRVAQGAGAAETLGIASPVEPAREPGGRTIASDICRPRRGLWPDRTGRPRVSLTLHPGLLSAARSAS